MKRKEADNIILNPMPTIHHFRAWKLHLRDEVASASGNPEMGFKWVLQAERPGIAMKDLYDSTPFALLDSKLAAALAKIMSGEFARQVNILKEECAAKDMLLKGRQVLLMLYRHYQISEVNGQWSDVRFPGLELR